MAIVEDRTTASVGIPRPRLHLMVTPFGALIPAVDQGSFHGLSGAQLPLLYGSPKGIVNPLLLQAQQKWSGVNSAQAHDRNIRHSPDRRSCHHAANLHVQRRPHI